LEVYLIGIDDEQFAFLVPRNPLLVSLVEAFEVVQAHAPFVIPAPRLNMGNQSGYAGAQINEQVGGLYLGRHGLKKAEIIFEVARCHQAHVVEVGGENVGIFVNGAVLHHGDITLQNFENLLISVVQEIDLKIERPALHVVVKICEVGVVFGALKMRDPTELSGEFFAKGGLSGTYVAGDGYVFDFRMFVLHTGRFLSGTKLGIQPRLGGE